MVTYSKSTWRLLITPPASGAWNMAVDEALLISNSNGLSLPTLRLFAWEPACISLGYAQPAEDVDLTRLDKLGWNLVRRPTGGRAILHADELTYSVVAPESEPRLEGGVLESYLRLSKALIASVNLLGINVQAKESTGFASEQETKGPVCFEVPSNYEITVNGKKLIGSAQARKKEGILQHGTLPLSGDLSRITQVLVYPSETSRANAAERLLERATTAENALGKFIPWDIAARAFIKGFESSLNVEFVEVPLSKQEISHIEKIMQEKYSNLAWTFRKRD